MIPRFPASVISSYPSNFQEIGDEWIDLEEDLEVSVLSSSISNQQDVVDPPRPLTRTSWSDRNSERTTGSSLRVSSSVFSNLNLIEETTEDKIRSFFRDKGVFVSPIEGESRFSLQYATFLHLRELINSLGPKEPLGRFEFDSNHQAICWDPDKSIQLIYPTTKQWKSLLSCLPVSDFDRCLFLMNSSNFLSEEKFVNDPLFHYTLEKSNVFYFLCRMRIREDFASLYQQFLDRTRLEEGIDIWDVYKDNPSQLAYLSLYAYLDGQIGQEELFTIHCLATAFEESKDSVQYSVLTSSNLENHLKESNYLSKEESIQNYPFLTEIERKKPLERMLISYQSEKGIDRIVFNLSKRACNMGFSSVGSSSDSFKVSLLPTDLFSSICKHRFGSNVPSEKHPPSEHSKGFGYRQDLNDLTKGRPISFPSPLFYIPQVHDIASKQLGILTHDLLGHAVADWLHPYVNEIIELGLETYKLNKQVGIMILDRAIEPVSDNSDLNVANFISSSEIFGKLSEKGLQHDFRDICLGKLPSKVVELVFEKIVLGNNCM